MDISTNWRLGCPAPAGVIAPGLYNAGPMSADDRQGPTEEDARMQIVCGADEADFERYIDILRETGGALYATNTIGLDRFASFSLNGKHFHVRWLALRREIRVVEEPIHISPLNFGYRAAGPVQTTVYQYGLYYDPDNHMTEKTANCGMLYIIHLCDNSLFMMDGGFLLQWREEALDALWQFMRRITGTGEDGTVRISGWYFTHTHADHIDGCVKLLNRHHDQIVLERLMYNFPAWSAIGGYEPSIIHVREQVARWYPQAKYLKLHTGQKFQLADMTLEVYYTQEDPVTPEIMDRFPLRDSNCASTILKLTVAGRTAMMLGDTNIETEDWLVRYSDSAAWKADMVQVAHHCFNYLDTLYDWIAAPAAMVPNSWGGAHQPENEPKLQAVLKHLENEQIYYEGGGTDGFIPGPEGWVHVAHFDVVGGEYDGSGY